ncbi:MAG TPA: DNA mismatch repair endonuclease MutL [Bacilli bacterium]|jgi:DNA mismatch repair protein MutL|nr:DNA mismatch repair endonuclease MutL [Bacilli bacterium]HQM18298.1 DNA mismatch repair endonuclease MutL [Bacilli bacterium]
MIKQLDKHLINLIKAGEVIEHCYSVVKELVENAIDAGAKNIVITLENSGLKEIKVLDDGSGMSEQEAKLAILPHHTSKILEEADLYHIDTLGFRGEALPSIIAVSSFKMKTSDNGVQGLLLSLKGGELVSEALIAQKKGTEITVRSLFYNTPVRLQNLKNEYVELSYIADFVMKIAFARPDIAFKLINNDKVLLHTFGSGNLLEVVNAIYGSEVAKNMLEIKGSSNLYQVSGYISNLNITRSSKGNMTFIVNGRSVKNNKLFNTVLDAYKGYLMIGKYPYVIINITSSSNLIDVNIHPSKIEVRFTEEKELEELIVSSIKKVLGKTNLTVYLDEEEKLEEIKEEPKKIDLETINVKETEELELEEQEVEIPVLKEEVTQYNLDFAELKEEKFSNFDYIGQLFNTYIILEDGNDFYLVDQHAAAERVNYELILDSLKEESHKKYELLVPINLQYSKRDYLLVLDHLDEIEHLGIELEEFGLNSFNIRVIPNWIFRGREKEFLDQIIDDIIHSKKTEREEFLDSLAINLACKKSIKASNRLSKEEVTTLLKDLEQTKNPYTCPHGRPTIVKLNKYELEKMFKRVV